MTVQKKTHGSYSCVEYLPDKTSVVKFPSGTTRHQKQNWYQHQCRAVRFLKLGFQSDGISIPQILEFSPDKVIETYQSGFPLTKENLASLPPKVQKKLAKRLASFISKLHQTASLQTHSSLTVHFLKSSIYFKAFHLPSSFSKAYLSYFNLLKQTDTSFQKVLCYRDLKAEHLLYDNTNDNLSVIDFGSVAFDIPIKDFCLDNPLRSQLHLPFFKDIIEFYNDLTPQNHLNKNIIKAYLYCSAFNEMISVCKTKKAPLCDIIGLGQILKDFLENLEEVFSSR